MADIRAQISNSACLITLVQILIALSFTSAAPESRLFASNYPWKSTANTFDEVSRSHRTLLQESPTDFGECQSQKYVYSGSTKDSIFDGLSVDEYTSAVAYLAETLDFRIPEAPNYYNILQGNGTQQGYPYDDQKRGNYQNLNFTATTFESYVFAADLFPINKAEALRYLDEEGPIPQRFARVVVVRGAAEVPDVMEYKVGPLPLGSDSSIQQLRKDGEIPFVKRPSNDFPENLALEERANLVMGTLKDLFMNFLGQCGDQRDPECADNEITSFNIVPATRENGKNRILIMLHFFAVGDSDAYELHNLPFAYKINVTEQDPSLWTTFEFEFCSQGFANEEDLLHAFQKKNLKICTPKEWVAKGYSAEWGVTGFHGGPQRDELTKPGPRLYEPAGKRFKLLQAESNTSRVFQWAGWQGHVTTNPWTGLSFHDIRFKGERILFELSHNDQMVAYSGYSSGGQTFYLDSFDQIGSSFYSLRPGYDCPETATYMPVTVMGFMGQQMQAGQAVCFFEEYTGTTSYRHFSYMDSGAAEVDSIRDYEFVVRAVSTLGNYDYIVTVRFRLDGSIHVEVAMAGYLQALFYDQPLGFSGPEEKFGTRVHTHTIGNIHDHLSSWKVDFDILGTNNTFHTTELVAGTYEDALGPGATPPWALPTDVMKYRLEKLVEHEQGFDIKKEPSYASFRIANRAKQNAWGAARAYGIFHGATTSQLLPDSHPITKAAAWSKYHIAVTKRKEDEDTSSKDQFDSHSPGFPVWSLDMALDNESIVDQDLVAWVSMGIQHVPRSEDVPVISNVACEFFIKPVNYFDQLPTSDIMDSDDFQACAPRQGDSFDYLYYAPAAMQRGSKAGFKLNGPISSRDVFQDPTDSSEQSFPEAQNTPNNRDQIPAFGK